MIVRYVCNVEVVAEIVGSYLQDKSSNWAIRRNLHYATIFSIELLKYPSKSLNSLVSLPFKSFHSNSSPVEIFWKDDLFFYSTAFYSKRDGLYIEIGTSQEERKRK